MAHYIEQRPTTNSDVGRPRLFPYRLKRWGMLVYDLRLERRQNFATFEVVRCGNLRIARLSTRKPRC